MGARRKGRELAVQALYQIEISGDASVKSLALFWDQADAGDQAKQFAAELLAGVRGRQAEIDTLIGKASTHWKLERLAPVDLCILRVATFELLASDIPPTSVILNEAIEIAKRFGTTDSRVFVNGVLDHIAEKLGVKENIGSEAQDDG
jgi:N utilization substance protein B